MNPVWTVGSRHDDLRAVHPRRFINASLRHSLLFSSFRPPPGEEGVPIGSISVSSHAGRTLRGGPKVRIDGYEWNIC